MRSKFIRELRLEVISFFCVGVVVHALRTSGEQVLKHLEARLQVCDCLASHFHSGSIRISFIRY